MKIIHITTGDSDGIGLEVSWKALYELGPKKGIQFVLWRSSSSPAEFPPSTSPFKIIRYSQFNDSILKNSQHQKENILLDIVGSPTPTQWVVESAQHCIKNPTQAALVTAPLSKTQMQTEGFKEKGHSHLLKRLSGAEFIFMSFLGEFFNVVLLTGHVPLKQIKWRDKDLKKCIELCLELKTKLNLSKMFSKNQFKLKNQKLAILGLNPHAGENGLIGTEEINLKKQINLIQKENLIEGPIVPDIAFFKTNWSKFFIYLCLYHDQALIPFKTIHERNSFQLSLGLPFTRTSVSHGTAKDIFKQNKADSQSMKQALLWAIDSLYNPKI